jgi:hypothetical protein
MKSGLLKYFFFSSLLSVAVSFTSCSESAKETVKPQEPQTSLVIQFDNVVGNEDLQLGKTYRNGVGEDFKIDLFQYFISNVVLTTKEGKVFTVPQDSSYFLIKENRPVTQKVKINKIPAGDYTEIKFMIGIDSLRNTSDASKRGGVLDVGTSHEDEEMYWDWNSGYIFVKMEGTSPQINTPNRRFLYHIGGFGGYRSRTINNIRTKTITLPALATVAVGKTPTIHMKVDALKMFVGKTNVSLAANPSVMFSTFSVQVAENYVEMFTIPKIDNQ